MTLAVPVARLPLQNTPDSGHADVRLRPLLREDADAWFACVWHPGMLEHTRWMLSSVADLASIFDALASKAQRTQLRSASVYARIPGDPRCWHAVDALRNVGFLARCGWPATSP